MLEFILFFLVIIISSIVFSLAQAAMLIIFNVKIKSIQLLYGKHLYTIKLKSFNIDIGWIPGSSISFDIDEYNQRSVFVRLFVHFVGPLSIILSSGLFITIDNALRELIRGFSQFYNLVIYPESYGQYLFGSLASFLSANDLFNIYAIIATKVAAVNLLPLPMLTGGRMILEILPISIKTKIIIINIFYIVALIMILSILYSYYLFLF